MKTKLRSFLPFLALAAALTLGACSEAGAVDLASLQALAKESGAEAEMEFNGMVQDFTATSLTVDGQAFSILPETQIKGDLKSGDFVKIHAALDENGEFSALEVELAPQPDEAHDGSDAESEFDFTGVVQAIADDTWTVDGQELAITTDTEIKGTLSIGDMAKVHAFADPDGALVASEIGPAEEDAQDQNGQDAQDAEFEYSGPVEAMGPESWTVDGQVLAITPDTEIKGTFQIGDMVKVHAMAGDGDTLVAREIGPAEGESDHGSSDGKNEEKIKGVLENIDGNVWTIDGQGYIVTDQTELKDQVTIGDYVEVKFTTADDGSLLAVEIKLDENGDESADQADDSSKDSEDESKDDHGSDSKDEHSDDDSGSSDSGDHEQEHD